MAGDQGGAAASPPPPAAEAAEPGSVRLQLADGARLGGCVAWDAASGLLAAELQAAQGGSTVPVAVLDPHAPEAHFVAHVPAAAPGERLAALLWSPPGARRLLLAVTAGGRAWAWTMDPPGGSSSGSELRVPCLNEWYGRHAFDLALSTAAPADQEQQQEQQQEQRQEQQERLVGCRFLQPPAAGGAAWDTAAAPPYADRPLTAAEVVAHFQRTGLEGAFTPPAAAPAAASPRAGAQPLSALHWLRPGTLCVAAVTSAGRLLLALSSLGGAGAGSGGRASGGSWVQLAPVDLTLPAAAAGGGLTCADVAAAGADALLVAAGGPGQLHLAEVAGLRQQVLASTSGDGGSSAAAGAPRVVLLPLPPSLADQAADALALALLPTPLPRSSTRLVAVSSSGGSASAAAVSLVASAASGPGSYAVEPGGSFGLGAAAPQAAAAAVGASRDGGALAVLLPGAAQLQWLSLGGDGVRSRRPPVRLPPSGGAAGAAAAAAISPHGMFAAVARRGARSLLLLPLVAQPGAALELEPFTLELGKRCCYALVCQGSSGGAGAWWDLCSAAAAACSVWGHQHLQLTQQLVDAAVLAARPDARPAYVQAWGQLKAALLAAAARAHPAAAADRVAAAVRADVAAREWVAVATAVFEHHLPDKKAWAAAQAQGPAALHAAIRQAMMRVLPARYWALWAADFVTYLTRCLCLWLRCKKGAALPPSPHLAPHAPGEPPAAAAARAFVAQQNALPDAVPCVRLLSDTNFYQSLGRLISGVHQMSVVLKQCARLKSGHQFAQLVQQLQVLECMAVLLRALHDAFRQNCGAGGEEGGAGEAAGAGYGGAWSLACVPPAPGVAWEQATAALRRIKEQAGGSPLLSRVRASLQLLAEQGAGPAAEGETPETLLAAAAKLGLLTPGGPACAAAPAGGAGSSAQLAALLQRRAAALAAAEGPAAFSAWEEEGEEAGAWPGLEQPWGLTAGSAASSARAAAAAAGRKRRRGQERRWEAERAAALGLPPSPAPADDPAAYEGRIDVLTGRHLAWEYPVGYAAADGTGATAELAPESLAAAPWQAAYVAAAPGGRAWLRLRAGG